MIIRSVKFITSAVTKDGYPQDILPHIVFAGRSNVGKYFFYKLNVKYEKDC